MIMIRASWMAALAVIVIGANVTSAADLHVKDGPKIMPMGDSITDGRDSGYREPLHSLLSKRGDSFTFVGSMTINSTAPLIAAGQVHHAGHGGFLIGPGSIADRQGKTLATHVECWIGPNAAGPDIILLMIGSNDICMNYDITNAPSRLDSLITQIYAYRPNVKLHLASPIPMAGREADVKAFNAAIPGIVAKHKALGHNVISVPMYEALNINTDLSDGMHPNALGYQHMAQAWDAALHANGEKLGHTQNNPAVTK